MTYKRCTVESTEKGYILYLIHSWYKLWEFPKYRKEVNDLIEAYNWLLTHPYDGKYITKDYLDELFKQFSVDNGVLDKDQVSITQIEGEDYEYINETREITDYTVKDNEGNEGNKDNKNENSDIKLQLTKSNSNYINFYEMKLNSIPVNKNHELWEHYAITHNSDEIEERINQKREAHNSAKTKKSKSLLSVRNTKKNRAFSKRNIKQQRK